jgi:hypothetical protein
LRIGKKVGETKIKCDKLFSMSTMMSAQKFVVGNSLFYSIYVNGIVVGVRESQHHKSNQIVGNVTQLIAITIERFSNLLVNKIVSLVMNSVIFTVLN